MFFIILVLIPLRHSLRPPPHSLVPQHALVLTHLLLAILDDLLVVPHLPKHFLLGLLVGLLPLVIVIDLSPIALTIDATQQ